MIRIVATIGGVVAGRIGGSGANEHLVLTNTIKTAKTTINRMASRNCVKYAAKMIASTKSWRNNILSCATWEGSFRFMAGCAFSGVVSNKWSKIKNYIMEFLK